MILEAGALAPDILILAARWTQDPRAHLLRATGAAHVEEVLVGAAVAPLRQRHVAFPLVALVLADAPGVALALHAFEDALQLGREVGLDLDLVPAHVDEARHVLDEDRARLLAHAWMSTWARSGRRWAEPEFATRPHLRLLERFTTRKPASPQLSVH